MPTDSCARGMERGEEGEKGIKGKVRKRSARVHEPVLYDRSYKIPANSASTKLFLKPKTGPKTDKNIVAKVLLIRAQEEMGEGRGKGGRLIPHKVRFRWIKPAVSDSSRNGVTKPRKSTLQNFFFFRKVSFLSHALNRLGKRLPICNPLSVTLILTILYNTS